MTYTVLLIPTVPAILIPYVVRMVSALVTGIPAASIWIHVVSTEQNAA